MVYMIVLGAVAIQIAAVKVLLKYADNPLYVEAMKNNPNYMNMGMY